MKQYLLASDFDQTLSFNDSGRILSDLLGIPDFAERAKGLAHLHRLPQGGGLAYRLLHRPQFRRVRREHLYEVGKRVRLKRNLPMLTRLLNGISGYGFAFNVISAAPEEVIQSALEGILASEHI